MSKIALSPNASGTGTFTLQAPNSNTNRTLDLPDAAGSVVVDAATQTLTNKTLTSPTITGASVSSMASSVLTLATAQNSTSGTSIDFTSIPSWVKRITVMLSGVSLSGSSIPLIQLGTTSGVVTTGYVSGAWTGNTTTTAQTIGLGLAGIGGATNDFTGNVIICGVGSNLWVSSHVLYQNVGGTIAMGGGRIALGGTLDRVRITTVNGTDTFDAGSINIIYE